MAQPRKTNESFIKESISKFGNVLDYSKTVYKTRLDSLILTCKIHGDFEILPTTHLNAKNPCGKCSRGNLSNEQFINLSKSIHGDKYLYDLTNYVKMKDKVIFTCKIHGNFEQRPQSHIHAKHGCPKCGGTSLIISEIWKKRVEIKHNNFYNYDNMIYINTYSIVKNIKCPKHGFFDQLATNHLKGAGCPICNNSCGELFIYNYLLTNNIKFKQQFAFEGCKYHRPLRFDFYIPDYNMCIEFDGIQHFKVVEKFGGSVQLEKTVLHDNIKNSFCFENNINILRIKYTDNVEEILNMHIV